MDYLIRQIIGISCPILGPLAGFILGRKMYKEKMYKAKSLEEEEKTKEQGLIITLTFILYGLVVGGVASMIILVYFVLPLRH